MYQCGCLVRLGSVPLMSQRATTARRMCRAVIIIMRTTARARAREGCHTLWLRVYGGAAARAYGQTSAATSGGAHFSCAGGDATNRWAARGVASRANHVTTPAASAIHIVQCPSTAASTYA